MSSGPAGRTHPLWLSPTGCVHVNAAQVRFHADEPGDHRDNWLELPLRFLVPPRGVRDVKSAMSRDIMAGLDAAGIGIASATYDIVGLPPVALQRPDEPAGA